jgi:methylthioribose-1-phosphate isomerase
VDETRPRNQGARLTAWELSSHGVDHTVIVDSAGGHLMQRGLVDPAITGTDRTTSTGGVFNKIGTYLKALAAHDTGVPVYVAVPGPSIDWSPSSDPLSVPIEERSADEVLSIEGLDDSGRLTSVRLTPEGSRAANPGFDFTPARLVTGLITERGVCDATDTGLRALYPERGSGREALQSAPAPP